MLYEQKLICPQHGTTLSLNKKKKSYICKSGCEFVIQDQIPRFVSCDNYASSFGLQWNNFRQTQLDSYTGVPISRQRLTRIAGGSLNIFKGKNVLEAGCGAGRFTEVMLEAGANVFAIDISDAVEANFNNCKKYENYYVCQVDILNAPIPHNQFDIVVCIGVIQHTPDPEKTIKKLCSYTKPGGLLLIDHYTYEYGITDLQRRIRKFLLNREKECSLHIVKFMTNLLWPIHIFLFRFKSIKIFRKLRSLFLSWSPIVDYHDAYPALGSELLYQWAILDTHDMLTDYYKHLKSAKEIQDILRDCGMIDIEIVYAGNGVEARAKKPSIQ